MNFKFSPIVEVDTDILNRDFVLVTAPHLVTDKMWDILHNCDAIFDIGVYTMKRKNQTQFEFYPNPGYTIDQVKSLVTAGTYLATIYTKPSDFWSNSFTFHFLQMRRVLEIKFGESADWDLTRYVFQAWISQEAAYRLRRDFEQKVAHSGVNNPSFTQARLDEALEAENRLFFAKPEDYGISDDIKRYRLSQISELSSLLERDHATMTDLSEKTLDLRITAEIAVEAFIRRLDAEELDSDWLPDAWKTAMDTINHSADELKKLEKQFNAERGATALKQIISLAPPAK